MNWTPRFNSDDSMLISRCIPGDEAVITRTPDITMMGKIVKVGPRIWPTIVDGRLVYCINKHRFTAYPTDGTVWLVEAMGYPFFLEQTSDGRQGAFYPMAPCRDAFLRPLRLEKGTDQMLLKAGPAPISRRVPRE